MKGAFLAIGRAARLANTLLTAYIAYMVEYRAELFFWVLSNSLPFILMGVWMEAATSGLFVLAPLEFARYFFAAFVVRQFNVVWVVWDFEREVVQGQLSHRLVQPLDPAWPHVAAHVAERVARFPLIVGAMLLFFALFPQALWWPGWGALGVAAIAIVAGFALRFLMQYTFALLAFWTERASAIEQLWFLLYLFLSGLAAPMAVFPPAMQRWIELTPFPYLIDFPVSLLLGRPTDAGRGFGMLLLWGILFAIANRWLWRRGLRHYSGMGA